MYRCLDMCGAFHAGRGCPMWDIEVLFENFEAKTNTLIRVHGNVGIETGTGGEERKWKK